MRLRPASALLLLLLPCCRNAAEPAAAQADLCGVGAPALGGPVQDSSGPYYHQVVVARTTDGLQLTGAQQVLEHASVPDGVQLADGRVLVYYVNGAMGAVYVAELTGDTVRVLGPLVVNGVSGPGGIVDPDAVRLANGRIRLYYLNGFGPPGTGAGRAICHAESTDGVHFTVRGESFVESAGELLTDPSVVPLADGSWRMAISAGQRTVLARSSDGYTFERVRTLDYGGVPELARAGGGALRLYVCARGGIDAYRSADGGASWSFERTTVPVRTGGRMILCDPSYVDGAGIFIYKTG